MSASAEAYIRRLMSGEARGLAAGAARALLRAAELPYAALMSARNHAYDRQWLRSHRLAAPVISIGNITAGGTGKTPVVRWLFGKLREIGMNPAVLMRGYGRRGGGMSDEQALLAESLSTHNRPALVHADPDRVTGGRHILRERPDTDVILLDDGFQHRRLVRQFDLVLIDATLPFGQGHVHPRGLLREPLSGLSRADAFMLTRSDQIPEATRREIEAVLREHNASAPVYAARHVHTGLRSAGVGLSEPPDLPLEALAGRSFFAAAGIANPRALESQLAALPGRFAGHLWFGDHHAFEEADLAALARAAKAAGAEVLLVTEKDWTKLRGLGASAGGEMPILRLELEVRMGPAAEAGLVELIQARLEARVSDSAPSPGRGPVR